MERRDIIILGGNAHMLKTVYSEYPVAMTWVPSRELQCHQDTVTDHTTFSAALSLELSELLFGTRKALLRKTIVCTDTGLFGFSKSKVGGDDIKGDSKA